MHKRMGFFYIADELLMDNPEVVQKILSKVIVLRAEHLFISRNMEYMAISNRFDEVEEGVKAPEYEVSIKNGFVSFYKAQRK